MARVTGGFVRKHGKLWYDQPSYRWSWLILPQALAAALFGLFVMDGGISNLLRTESKPIGQQQSEWAKPSQENDTLSALNPLRDKAGKDGDKAALAALEQMAANGDAGASFKLGTLYDPSMTDLPHPQQKDVKRSLELYAPGVKAGIYLAQYNTMRHLITRESGAYDVEAACKLARDINKNPDFAAGKRSKEDDWVILTVADCYAGIFRPDNVAFTQPSKEDAKIAIDLYLDPLVSNYLDARSQVARMYLEPASPVHDFVAGCATARKWEEAATQNNYDVQQKDAWIAGTTAGCMLNVYRPPGVTYTVPPVADQNKALALLEKPAIQNDASVQRTAWMAYVNKSLAIHDPAKACDRARAWARNPQPEADLPVDNQFFTTMADCLMGVFPLPGTPAHSPDENDAKLARNLYMRIAQAGDPLGYYRIGYISERGVGPWPKDMAEARDVYEKCAAADLIQCKARLGLFKEFGWAGEQEDKAGALKIYQSCAKQGSTYCEGRLAMFYAEGLGGLKRDYAMSTKLARHAAEAGDGLAAEVLAYNLYAGLGSKPDAAEAGKWMVEAIARNGSDTLDHLKNVNAAKLTEPAFWSSFHAELKAKAAYFGPLATTPSTETFEAARKLFQ